jgi:hypothetical protein
MQTYRKPLMQAFELSGEAAGCGPCLTLSVSVGSQTATLQSPTRCPAGPLPGLPTVGGLPRVDLTHIGVTVPVPTGP